MAIKITIQTVADANSFKIKEYPSEFFESKTKSYELYRNKNSNADGNKILFSARNVNSGEYLFSNVAVEEVAVDGVTYPNYENLSSVLTPILFKKGGGTGGGGTSVWSSDVLLGYQFGKYSAGSTLPSNGKTDEEIIKDAFQGVLDANVVAPSFSFTRNNSTTLFEVGSTLAQQFTGTYNPGGIYGKMINGSWQTASNSTNKQADRAGALQSMTLDGETFNPSANPQTNNSSKIITLGNNVFNGSVNFLAGTARPKRSDDSEYGAVYTTPLTLSSSITVTGLIPYFYGIINDNQTIDDINLSTLTKVVASSTGNISIPYSGVVGKKLVILIPSTSAVKTKWFVDALNNGNIGNTGDLFPSVVTRNYDSPTSLWTNQSFNVYVSTTTSLDNTIQLQN